EAEERLRRSLALKALATAEQIELEAGDLEAKLQEISQGLSDQTNIDPERLRLAVAEDLLRDKLLDWLEANSTISEKAPAAEEEPAETTDKAKAKTKAEAKAKAETKPKSTDQED
ncbi:MAG: trigger factor, partial [Cyanobium sp.]